MKKFISVKDWCEGSTLRAGIEAALSYRANPKKDAELGRGLRVGLLFFNPSLRTRLSTQIAAQNLGCEEIVMNSGQDGWALEFEDGAIMNGTTVEHIKDAAPILGGYFDILCIRTFPSLKNRALDELDTVIESFIKYSGIPVVSLESATLHPLQSFADVITIADEIADRPKVSKKPKVVLTWAPHVKAIPQCVANSFAEWMLAWDEVDFTITHPPGYELSSKYIGTLKTEYDQGLAIEDADFIYVKNWSSVEPYAQILGDHRHFLLTEERLGKNRDAKIMHCLPVRRNVELSDSLLDGPRSLTTAMAMNRVLSAQSVFARIIRDMKR